MKVNYHSFCCLQKIYTTVASRHSSINTHICLITQSQSLPCTGIFNFHIRILESHIWSWKLGYTSSVRNLSAGVVGLAYGSLVMVPDQKGKIREIDTQYSGACIFASVCVCVCESVYVTLLEIRDHTRSANICGKRRKDELMRQWDTVSGVARFRQVFNKKYKCMPKVSVFVNNIVLNILHIILNVYKQIWNNILYKV